MVPKQLRHMICPTHSPPRQAQPDIYREEAKKESSSQPHRRMEGLSMALVPTPVLPFQNHIHISH